MNVKIYRAGSLQEALSLVRDDLGDAASVLRTREVGGGLFGWLKRRRMIEVTASAAPAAPSRSRAPAAPAETAADRSTAPSPKPKRTVAMTPRIRPSAAAPAAGTARRGPFARPIHQAALGLDLEEAGARCGAGDVEQRLDRLESLSAELPGVGFGAQSPISPPDGLRRLFAELLAADLSEPLARRLVDRLRQEVGGERWESPHSLKARLARILAAEIPVAGPIRCQPGACRMVAMVGPTGVGKTTTIAKLAAHYQLRERLRVGLVTVDTYRIAAVEQLRTYAEIIDAPLEAVSTPAELAAAARRLCHLDLVLLDTAGRSPRDEEQIQELENLLRAAAPDEVHLVLSGTASVASLEPTAARFARAGATALILTKLDEAHGLGNLLALWRSLKLPLSYVTQGQQVPDDIAAADAHWLARRMLGLS